MKFFEKPGCITNGKQKSLLRKSGVTLEVFNLLEHPWQKDELASYFSGLRVSDWFNQSAPSIKSGQLDPAALTEDEALEAMLANPLLIRRPLIENGEWRMAGFDMERLQELLIGLSLQAYNATAVREQCSRPENGGHCG